MTEMTVGAALVLSAICFPVAVLIIGGLVGWLHRLTLDNRALRDTVRGLNRRIDDLNALRRADGETWLVLREAGELFRRYERHHTSKGDAMEAGDLCPFCGTDGFGSDHGPSCPNHPEPADDEPPSLLSDCRSKAERNRLIAEKIEKELARNAPKPLRAAHPFTEACERLHATMEGAHGAGR